MRKRFPIATVSFIAACIGAAFFVLWNPSFLDQLGFDSARPSLIAAFTSLFLHQNLLHLLGNMVFLAAVGPAVELAAGTGRFVLVYLVGGLLGVAFHWFLSPRIGGMPPLVGASGCVAACIAYYSLRYMSLRVAVFTGVGVPLMAVVAVWAVLQVLGGFITIGETASVSYWAHLGGFAFGLATGLLFGAPSLNQVELGHKALDRMNHRGPDALLQAAEHHLKQHPKDVRALQERVEAFCLLGEKEKEAQAILPLLQQLPEIEQASPLRRLVELGKATSLPSLRRSLIADQFKSSEPELAHSLLESVAQGPPDDPQKPDALLALLAMDRETKPEKAEKWLAELLSLYPMHPATELARRRGWTP